MNYFLAHKRRRLCHGLLFVLFCAWPAWVWADSPPVTPQDMELTDKPAQSRPDLEAIDFANGLFERGFWTMALEEYKKFVYTFPESDFLDEAYYGVAESLFFLKDYPKAIGAFNSYKELYPEGAKIQIIHLRLGQCAYFTERYASALTHFKRADVTKMDEDFRPIYYLYAGKTHARLKHFSKAQKALTKAIDLSPQTEYAFHATMELADLANQKENFIQAIEHYQDLYTLADTTKRKANVLYKQGEVYLFIKRYPKAIESFERILSEFPDQEIAADAQKSLLMAHYNAEQYRDVVRAFENNEERIHKGPVVDVFDAYYLTALAQIQLNAREEALALLNKILRREDLPDEQSRKAMIKRVEILVALGHFQKALALTEDYLPKVARDKDELLFWKAEALYGLKDYEKAAYVYQQIQTQYKDSGRPDEVLYALAYAQWKADHLAEAAALFEQYATQGDNDAHQKEAAYNVIVIYQDLNEHAAAIEFAETFIDKFPASERTEKVLYLLGHLYSKANEHARAVEVCQKLVKLFPASDRLQDVWFLLAFSFQSLDKDQEALRYYGKLHAREIARHLRYPALKNSALIHLDNQAKQKAADTFFEIIRAYPDNDLKLETLLWVAEAYYLSQQYEPMVTVLSQAETKADEKQTQAQGQITFLKAQAFRQLGEIQKAQEHYSALLAMPEDTPYRAASHIGLGLCHMHENKYAKAQQAFETALLENTEDNTITMRARYEMANLYRAMEDYEKAAKFYMFVSVLYDEERFCAPALFKAGEMFELLDQKQKALSVYQELVKRYPKSAFSEKARQKLKGSHEH
jgi:tetratricopeptide (TPR) repeat protein